MKCSQCNSQSLTQIHSIFTISGEANLHYSRFLEIYACDECGHLEFFDNSLNHKRKQEKKVVEDFDKELSLLREKNDLITTGSLREATVQLAKIQEQLTSLDITIRQQKKLQQQAETLNAEIRKINREIAKIQEEISSVKARKQHALNEIAEQYHVARFGF